MSNKPVTIPNTFASATSAIPLSQLDGDFSALANVTNDLITYSNYVADTGVADAYIANFASGINTSSLAAGLLVQFKAGNANTGTSTLAVKVNGSTIGTATIKYADGTNLAAGAIAAGAIVTVQYDGTNFQLMNDPAGKSGGDVTGPSSATNNGIALFDGTTGKLLKDSASTDGLINGVTVGKGGGNVAGNTVVGAGSSLAANTTGSRNTVVGSASLQANTTGASNTAMGIGAMYFNTTGNYNTAIGDAANQGCVSGGANTAVGCQSLTSNTASNNTAVGYQALYTNTGGNSTAVGYQALKANTTGGSEAFGYQALGANTTGASNNAFGLLTLSSNTTGSYNTAFGQQALISNTTASNNTAVGYQAGYLNTTGTLTALGRRAGYNNTTGADNTFIGVDVTANSVATTGNNNTGVGNYSFYNLSSGASNTALGVYALYSNTTASNNTAVGYQAGYSNTTGAGNTVCGMQALYTNSTGPNNTVVGQYALNLATGSTNTAIGYGSGSVITTGNKNSILGAYSGNQGGLDIRTASNYIVLSDGDGNPRMYFNGSGNPYLNNVGSGAGTNALKYNTASGLVTYDTSSARYKDNIRDSKYGLADVLKMRSTQFEYKDDGRSDVGLIAEELQPIIPELVGVNKNGEADSVSYDRMVSVLIKAIQELKATVDAQAERIAVLEGAK